MIEARINGKYEIDGLINLLFCEIVENCVRYGVLTSNDGALKKYREIFFIAGLTDRQDFSAVEPHL